LATPQGRRRL